MSGGGTGRFEKGRSGNPAGRPKAWRPNNSAFDIIFDKTFTVLQGGTERELTVDEALQIQTYQAALKGSKMAVRAVLKMIEKREAAISKRNPTKTSAPKLEIEHCSSNADRALRLLEIATEEHDMPGGGGARTLKLATWAAQLAISRPGRRTLTDKDVDDINRHTVDPQTIRWPRRRSK